MGVRKWLAVLEELVLRVWVGDVADVDDAEVEGRMSAAGARDGPNLELLLSLRRC